MIGKALLVTGSSVLISLALFIPFISSDWNERFSDNFDDNSLDTDKWLTYTPDAGTVTETSQRLEIEVTTGQAHTGSGAYTKTSFITTGSYMISYDYYDAMSTNENGFDGLWIENADNILDSANYREGAYGNSMCGIFYSVSYDGSVDNCGRAAADCVGIFAHDTSCSTWHGTFSSQVDENNTAGIIAQGNWYSINITMNWTSNYSEIYVDNELVADGIVPAADVAYIGDYFKVQWYEADYNKAGGSYIDNVTIYWTGVIEACEEIGSGTTLSADSSDCYVFNQNNTVLDCAGYKINNTLIVDEWAINATGRGNITIKDCLIQDTTYGVLFDTTSNSFVLNTTLYNISDISGSNVEANVNP